MAINSGGAGSGYIGNPLLSNKKMVGYNVPTSSAESTKTESVSEASENPVSGKPKIGNGFARIKFLRDVQPQPEPGYDDILNKLQNYIIWGSWDFKTKGKKEYYSGSRTITCDFPCVVLNDAQMLQSNNWASNGTTYFCGGCRVDVNGEDNIGYDIIVSRLTDTKPIHREGVTDDACNKATQLIYTSGGGGATGIGNPAVTTLPETLSYRLEYSTVKLRNALEKMIEMVVGSCDLFVNGSPWILR